LQEEKKAKVIEITDSKKESKAEEQARPKPKRARRGRKPRFDPEQSAVEAQALLEIIGLMRRGLDVEKPIPDHAVALFHTGYVQVVMQYGPVASQYMPLIIFGTSLLIIGADTWVEAKKIAIAKKAKRIKEQKEKVSASEPVDVDFAPIPEGEKMEPDLDLTAPDTKGEIEGL